MPENPESFYQTFRVLFKNGFLCATWNKCIKMNTLEDIYYLCLLINTKTTPHESRIKAVRRNHHYSKI